MRSLILIVATVVLLVGGLALYTWMQPAPPARPLRTLAGPTTMQRLDAGESIRGVGSGEHAWVKRYVNGELHSQFRGERYEPQNDGTVHVVRPQAEFFSSDGRQRVRIEGEQGDVVTELPPESDDPLLQSRSADMSPPTRGNLQDVEVSIFQPADAAEPVLVARMKNAVFDADKFRIATEGYTDANGNRVAADEVPVVVRGRDYDFDGRGLIIGWNERDRKLQLLEVTHGQSLTIKNAALLSSRIESPTTQPGASSFLPLRALREGVGVRVRSLDGMLASTDARSANLILAASSPTRARRRRPPRPAPPPPATRITRDLSPVVYRATFERDVRILEGDTQIASLDRMLIDILQDSSADATTQPASPGPAPRSKRRDASGDSEDAPATAAAPLTVRWSGKLRVVPLEGTPDPALVPDKPVVHLLGAPVVLTRDGTEARCAALVYNSADSSAKLSASEAVPAVTLVTAAGAHITTPLLKYTRTESGQGVATLTGASRAELPVESDGGTPQIVTATWTDEGRMLFSSTGAGDGNGADDADAVIEQVDLAGVVVVEHPQLNMKGEALSLAFDPLPSTTTQPSQNPTGTLREIFASGDVKCELLDDTQPRSIAAQRLRVFTARTSNNATYARRFEADGDVRTNENGNELRAGHLSADLEPATQPVASADAAAGAAFAGGDVRLVSLEARDNVRLISPDGARALADQLTLDTEGEKVFYRLTGAPATITDGKMTLTGPEIRFAPEQNLAEIPRGGVFDGAPPSDPAQKVHIEWTGRATIDGNADVIDVSDNVVMSATQPDGTINGAKSKHLRAHLAPKPTTAPAATKESSNDSDPRVAFLSGKELTTATLTGDVEVASELKAADGTLLRGVNLFAQTVNFDQRTGRFEVPREGKMIFRDHRPPDPAAEKAEGPSIGSGRGDTVFVWKKSLVYDPTRSEATMNGDVLVIHRPQGDGEPFNINAQTLTALLERDDAKQSATTRPADAQVIRVRRVTASGDVHVTSKRLNFDGPNLAYDPIQQVLIATGNDAYPITVYDNETGSSSTASQLWWNTETDQFKITKLVGKVRQ